MECVRNVEADIFHLRHWSNLECVEEEMMFTDGMEGCMESYWNGMCLEYWGGHIPFETLANRSVPWHPLPLQGSDDPALLAICCEKGWCWILQTELVKVLQGISDEILWHIPGHERRLLAPRSCVLFRILPIWPSSTVSDWSSSCLEFLLQSTLLLHQWFPEVGEDEGSDLLLGRPVLVLIWWHWRWGEVCSWRGEDEGDMHRFWLFWWWWRGLASSGRVSAKAWWFGCHWHLSKPCLQVGNLELGCSILPCCLWI